MNNNNYSKYLKYKTKYLELQKTMQVGGAPIDDMSDLIFNNIPTTLYHPEAEGYNMRSVNPPWKRFIERLPASYKGPHTESRYEILNSEEYDKQFRFKKEIIPALTMLNNRGQTLHYLAGLKGNNSFLMFLYKTCQEIHRDFITILNADGSSVLHAIAWGEDIDLNRKFNMIANILNRLVPDRNAFNNIPNNRGESWRDNLRRRHPELTHNLIIERIGF